MYKWAVRLMIRRNTEALASGDIGPLMRSYTDHSVLVFPGNSSWAGSHRGTAAIEAFLRRFVSVGLKGEVQEILVNGPPWRTTICVLFTDRAEDSSGNEVYANRVVLFGRAVWGKLVYQEDFLDTAKVNTFDAYLERSAKGGV